MIAALIGVAALCFQPPSMEQAQRRAWYQWLLWQHQQEMEQMPALAAYFSESGVAAALQSGNSHVLIVGDSITAPTNNTRFPSALFREWGAPDMSALVGFRCPTTDGVTDSLGRSFKGSANLTGNFLKPGPGIEIQASGGSGTFTFGEVVTESGTGYTAIFLGEAGGTVKLGYGPGDNNAIVGGGSTLSGASASRTLASVVGAVTTDPDGLAMNLYPCSYAHLKAGNVALSGTFYRSIMQNTASSAGGEWTASLEVTGRLIYLRHAGGFNGKKRTYRNSVSVNQTNFNQQTDADDTVAYTEQACGTGSGIPCEVRWEGLSGDESGQIGKMPGALFYRPGVASGFSFDSVSIGGDGIDKCLDTGICSDAHYAEYLAATRRPEADTLIVMLWYGQNDAGLSQATFEARLASAITRFTSLGETAGYTAVKFILVSSYNTGSAHLSGKSDACYNVATANSDVACFFNLYDRYTEAYVTANTLDGIHPTLAFSQEIAADMSDEIASPTPTAAAVSVVSAAPAAVLLGLLD